MTTLVIAVDFTAYYWSIQNNIKNGIINIYIKNILSFAKIYQLKNIYNHIAIVIYDTISKKYEYVYSSYKEENSFIDEMKHSIIVNKIINFIKSNINDFQNTKDRLNLSFILSMCLLYINRWNNNQSFPSYIALLKITPDILTHYSYVISSAMAAKNSNCMINSICIGHVSDQLIQVCNLTGGEIINNFDITDKLCVFSWLTNNIAFKSECISIGKSNENSTSLQALANNIKTFCICHKHAIDIGFVCSSCLSVYCNQVSECINCKKKFKLKTIH